MSEWDIFFTESLTSSVRLGSEEGTIFFICMILAFVFTLIAFFIGLSGIMKIDKIKSNTLLTAGVMGIIAMILTVVGFSQLGTTGLNYGVGFFLIITSFILYFVSFGIQRILHFIKM